MTLLGIPDRDGGDIADKWASQIGLILPRSSLFPVPSFSIFVATDLTVTFVTPVVDDVLISTSISLSSDPFICAVYHFKIPPCVAKNVSTPGSSNWHIYAAKLSGASVAVGCLLF